jgi:putative effector of murein hydrolase
MTRTSARSGSISRPRRCSGLTITLLAYQAAFWLYQALGQQPAGQPGVDRRGHAGAFLMLTGTRYETYFAGAQFVHFLLGPATVALAIPLYTQFKRVRRCCCRCWPACSPAA